MQTHLIICNMSGIYEQQDFYRGESHQILELKNTEGTNGYCDDAAAQILAENLQSQINNTLYFIDNGNYHYISKLRCDTIGEPFDLVVFDHHSDMEEPMFGSILSCGSWILFTLRENPHLRRILLIGPDAEQIRLCLNPVLAEDPTVEKKITVISQEEIEGGKHPGKLRTWLEAGEGVPFFLSIDKDVLSKETVKTNWDQGSMNLATMEEILQAFGGVRLLGTDICGEGAMNDPSLTGEDIARSSQVNERLIAILKGLLYT
ncbi:MAG: arginase family protein [Lachnospiraceae bacterium]|nr:arginase family protein [Lachnospiraceae bacterium]